MPNLSTGRCLRILPAIAILRNIPSVSTMPKTVDNAEVLKILARTLEEMVMTDPDEAIIVIIGIVKVIVKMRDELPLWNIRDIGHMLDGVIILLRP